MYYSFHPGEEKIPVCSAEHTGIFSSSRQDTSISQLSFALYPDSKYRNKQYRYLRDSYLFDGYSDWFRGEAGILPDTEHFTISMSFLPLTLSAHGDGLFSCYQDPSTLYPQRTAFGPDRNLGLEILLNKGGRITVRTGTISFSSLRSHVQCGVWNVITVVYRGDAGWVDLYVNGIFSNRKQFRRHTRLSFPQTAPYIGRRTDSGFFKERAPFGCYYGYMKWVDLETSAPTPDDVLALHRKLFTGERDEEAFFYGMPDPEAYQQDPNRPVLHPITPGRWMNEPHGPLYYHGWYHLFYQGNPHAPIWDHLCWGHIRSRDLIHWESCPLALIPEKESTAPDGCWSGSSVIDKDGKTRIYFTAGDDSRFPNQAVALAKPEDEDLFFWNSEKELIQTQDVGWLGEFRDPFVWLEDDRYFMLVGTGDPANGGGNAALYSSDDGLQFISHGLFMEDLYEENPELGHVWELPVFLPLRDETGRIVCHILLLCACQIEGEIVETYYFLGHWDPKQLRFTPFSKKAGLLDLGRGCFTGPSGFVTPDQRSLVFTIAQGKRTFPDEIQAGWAHNGGLPVELSIRQGQLQIQPIRELQALCQEPLLNLSRPGAAQASQSLAEWIGDTLYLIYRAAGSYASVTIHFGDSQRTIYYDRSTQRLGVLDENSQEIGRFRGEIDQVSIGDEEICFQCILDHSMLEIYLNGRKSITLRNYTAESESRWFEVSGNPAEVTLWKIS